MTAAVARQAQAIAEGARRAAARGNEPVPGDVMAQSFNENVWLDNSDPTNTGKSRAVNDFNQSLNAANVMTNFTLFLIP
jgi:hypothetical protein